MILTAVPDAHNRAPAGARADSHSIIHIQFAILQCVALVPIMLYHPNIEDNPDFNYVFQTCSMIPISSRNTINICYLVVVVYVLGSYETKDDESST